MSTSIYWKPVAATRDTGTGLGADTTSHTVTVTLELRHQQADAEPFATIAIQMPPNADGTVALQLAREACGRVAADLARQAQADALIATALAYPGRTEVFP